MKKKSSILLLCIALTLVFSVLIYTVFHKQEIALYYPKTKTIMYDMPWSDIQNTIKIEKSWISSYHVLSSLFLHESERILMFSCKKEYKEHVKNAAHDYVYKLKKQYQNSLELAYIQNYREYIQDDFYFLVISKDADTILKDIKKKFK